MGAIDWSQVYGPGQPGPAKSGGIDWNMVNSTPSRPQAKTASALIVTKPQTAPQAAQPSLMHRMFDPYIAAAKGAYRGVQDVTDSVVQGGASLADMVLGHKPTLSGLVTGNDGTWRSKVDAAVNAGHQAFDQQYGGQGFISRVAQNARFGGNVLATAPVGGVKVVQGAGLLRGAANSAIQGATQGALLSSTNDMSGLQNAGVGAAGGVLMHGVASVMAPKVRPDVQVLLDHGVTPTPGQILGGGWKATEDKLTSVPVIGDIIKRGQQRAVQQLNTAAYNDALAPIGQSYSGPAGRDAVGAVRQAISDNYNQLLPKMGFASDPEFQSATDQLNGLAKNLAPPQLDQFNSILNNGFYSKLSPNGGMTGETVKGAQEMILDAAKGYRSDPSYDSRQLGNALLQFGSNVDDALARQNGDLGQQLSNTNLAYAKYARLRDAASRVGTDDGVFSPAQYHSAIRAGDGSAGKGAFASGDALNQDLSQAAVNVLGKNYPDSGTAGRSALQYLGVAAPVVMAKPELLPLYLGATAGGAGISALYSTPGQQLAAAILAMRPEGAQAAAQVLQQLSPAATSAAIDYAGNQ